jgi:hypothetical protein
LNAHFSAPHFLTDLIDIYGSPSQAGFGSAVFYEKIEKNADLESIALQYYQYFLGDLWTRLGETAWLSTWKPAFLTNFVIAIAKSFIWYRFNLSLTGNSKTTVCCFRRSLER